MINLATTLLSTLHQELSSCNGYIAVAPAKATYPYCTYTLINSSPTRAKSFTSDGMIYQVQFSYFDDTSFLNCMTLATSAETKIKSLSSYFYVDNGNQTTIANTENGNFYQLIDTRTIEIIEENIVTPITPIAKTYDFLGLIDGDLNNPLNYFLEGIPTSIDTVNFKSSFYKTIPTTGTLTCSTLNFDNDTQEFLQYLDLPSTVNVNGNVIFTAGRYYTRNSAILTNATFNTRTINNGTVTNATFIPFNDGYSWNYPENNGTVTNAICYWLEGDYTLGGTITNPITYMGYPV